MKKILLFLVLFLLCSNSTFAVEKIYLQENYPSSINRQYRPYNYYNNSHCIHCKQRRNHYNNAKRLQQIQKIKLLNRIRNNFLTVNGFNNGSLTGYSVPISPNIYSQLGVSPWDNLQYKNTPTNLTTELFSSPKTTERYYKNGEIIRDIGGISNKTGVTIIYD